MSNQAAKTAMNVECELEPYADKKGKFINVMIETPRGNRNKFKYDDALSCFRLGSVLPAAPRFPTTSASFPARKPTMAIRSTYCC